MAGRHKTKGSGRSFEFLSEFSWFVPDVGGLIMILVMFLVGFALSAVVGMLVTATAGMVFFNIYGNLIIYPLMFVPPMMYCMNRSRGNRFFYEGKAIDNNRFAPLGGCVAAIVAVLATFAMSVATDWIAEVMPPMPEDLENALKMVTEDSPLWVSLLSVSVFAPLFEEWLCRGMVLRGLLDHMKPVWAIILSAAVFGLIHMNPWQAIPAFLIGCLMGYVYYRTGSLKLTMLMHCANNTLAVFLSRIPALADADSIYQVMSNHWPYWIMVAASVIIIVLSINSFHMVKLEDERGNFQRLGNGFSD